MVQGVEDRQYRVLASMGCFLNYATFLTFCLLPSAGLPLTDFPCGSFGFAFFLLTTYSLSIREGGWIKAFLIAIPVCILAVIASYLLGCLHGNDCDLMWTLQPSYEECQTIPGLKWIVQQSCLEHETRAKTYSAPMLFASDI